MQHKTYIYIYIYIYIYTYTHTQPTYLTEDCDEFETAIYTANFPNGTTRVIVPIDISDDDVYEENESFYITIIDPSAHRVAVGTPSRAEVVIVNDDESK